MYFKLQKFVYYNNAGTVFFLSLLISESTKIFNDVEHQDELSLVIAGFLSPTQYKG